MLFWHRTTTKFIVLPQTRTVQWGWGGVSMRILMHFFFSDVGTEHCFFTCPGRLTDKHGMKSWTFSNSEDHFTNPTTRHWILYIMFIFISLAPPEFNFELQRSSAEDSFKFRVCHKQYFRRINVYKNVGSSTELHVIQFWLFGQEKESCGGPVKKRRDFDRF